MFNYYSLSVSVTFVFKVNLNKFENWYKNEMKMFSFFVDLLRFIEKATETNNNEILSCTYGIENAKKVTRLKSEKSKSSSLF